MPPAFCQSFVTSAGNTQITKMARVPMSYKQKGGLAHHGPTTTFSQRDKPNDPPQPPQGVRKPHCSLSHGALNGIRLVRSPRTLRFGPLWLSQLSDSGTHYVCPPSATVLALFRGFWPCCFVSSSIGSASGHRERGRGPGRTGSDGSYGNDRRRVSCEIRRRTKSDSARFCRLCFAYCLCSAPLFSAHAIVCFSPCSLLCHLSPSPSLSCFCLFLHLFYLRFCFGFRPG